MSECRYRPKCECAVGQALQFEYKTIAVVTNALLGMVMDRVQSGMCQDSEKYVAITAISCIVSGLSCDPDGRNPGVVESERMERVLSTLVEDVRLRIAQIEAIKEQVKQGGTRQ